MIANTVEEEYADISSKNGWALVYQKIGRECQAYPYTCNEARKPANKGLNRYRDVNPYDHSRIVLRRGTQDYINANLVKAERANRKYILTQGPLVGTVSHFWLMVWEQDSRAILMLNKLIEKNEVKCHWYWPHGVGEQHRLELEDVKLTVEQLSEEDRIYYSTREFRLVDLETNAFRTVVQFHYTTWPDFGVPSSPLAFLDFLRRVRAAGGLDDSVGPPIVHCSAGIGRSGTFCLVEACLHIIETGGDSDVKVQEILLEMRRDRMGLIQTPDQLRFCYQAIIKGAQTIGQDLLEDPELYAEVTEAEEAPPPPPPRGESLAGGPPARPLPAIPASASLGALSYAAGRPPLPPPVEDYSSDESSSAPTHSSTPTPLSTADEDEARGSPVAVPIVGGEGDSLRKRRLRDKALAEMVSDMKRRARAAERWHALKRSLYKPLTITFGVLLASIFIYSYVKH